MAFTGFTYPNIDAKGNPTTVYTEAIVPVGTRAVDNDGNEYIFLPGVASVVAGDWVKYNPDTFATTRLVANAIGPVAVFQAAVDSTAEYGWAMIRGKVTANGLAGLVAGTNLFCTATAGSVDDAVVVGDLIVGAFSATAISGSQFTAWLNYPVATDEVPAA